MRMNEKSIVKLKMEGTKNNDDLMTSRNYFYKISKKQSNYSSFNWTRRKGKQKKFNLFAFVRWKPPTSSKMF